MTDQEYTDGVLRTLSDKFDKDNAQGIKNQLHAAMGIATEAGELLDAYKKHVFYGKELDVANLIEELGDLEWYAAVLRDELGVTREQVLEININKLKKRYPDGFTSDKAINRDLDGERDILEGN